MDYGSLPINPGEAEIRLITIHPCEDVSYGAALLGNLAERAEGFPHTTPLKCSIDIVSLNDCPLYTALSYTWGPDSDLRIVRINNQDVTVRPNLEAALRHIQEDKRPVTLWIDAVCINQNDEVEKSQQVQMMRTIYEKALSVSVWLGPAEDDSDAVMDLLNNIGAQALEAGILNLRLEDLSSWFTIDRNEHLDALRTRLSDLAEKAGWGILQPALRPFSKRKYWKRVWIMQEVSVARDITFDLWLKTTSIYHLRSRLLFLGIFLVEIGENPDYNTVARPCARAAYKIYEGEPTRPTRVRPKYYHRSSTNASVGNGFTRVPQKVVANSLHRTSDRTPTGCHRSQRQIIWDSGARSKNPTAWYRT
jgi:hypothetical protein